MHTQWEYTVLKLPMDFGYFSGTDFDATEITNYLNEFGRQGWELVSSVGVQQARGDTSAICAVMKRPRSAAGSPSQH